MMFRTLAMAAIPVVFCFGNAIQGKACTPDLANPPLVKAGELLASINPTVAPIQYVDDNGKLAGLDVDLGNAIAERMCLKMVLMSTQFATMIPLLKEGRTDLINSFMFYTPERAAQVMMVPYGASTLAIVVPKQNTDTITGPEYFSKKIFAVELGTVDASIAAATSEKLQKEGKPAIDVRTFSTYADVLQSVAAGQADGAFIGTEQAVYYRHKGVNFFRIALSGYAPNAEALAFHDPKIADAVVRTLNDMQQDGSLGKLFARYGHCTLPGPFKITTGPIEKPKCVPVID
jgi:polar amino acid transport system substrate-binding protein